MITNSKQNWAVGHTVKVGFLTLVVKALIETPQDYQPDAYILANTSGTQLYKFVPHNGLEKLSTDEAKAMLEDQAKISNARYFRQAEAAAQRCAVDSIFAPTAAVADDADAIRGRQILSVFA